LGKGFTYTPHSHECRINHMHQSSGRESLK